MSMELEGNILLERAPMRRWVSIVAVVVPAAAFAMLATWFIRIYIVPPTVAIPGPVMLASAPQEPAPPQQIEAKHPGAAAPTASVSAVQVSVTAPSVAEPVALPGPSPMLNTLSATAPPAELPPAAPPQEHSAPATVGVAQAAFDESAPEATGSIPGPIPIPRSKPRLSLARVTGPVPLPRPKPAEDLPPSDLPANDIHAVQ
jgi:hypothetical protein